MIYVSTACIKSEFVRNSVVEIVKMGIRNVELSGGTKYYPEYLNDLIELKNQYGLSYLIHNYFPPPDNKKDGFVLNFTSSSEQTYSCSFNLIRKAVSVSESLGAALYTFHPGYTVEMGTHQKGLYFSYSDNLLQSKEEKESLFYSRFDLLLEALSGSCVSIAIENLFPFDTQKDYSLFSRPEEIMRFLQRYADTPTVGLLLDLGHLNVSSYYLGFDKFNFIERLFHDFPDKIFEIHLSENDGTGDYHFASKAGSWQISVINDNYDLVKKIPVTFEWYSDCSSREQFSWFKEVINLLRV